MIHVKNWNCSSSIIAVSDEESMRGDNPDLVQETAGHKPPIRLVNPDGRYNIKYIGVTGQRKQFFNDFFTTMVDTRWRWNILMFVGSFIVTWLLFAIYYYLVSKFHGDLDIDKTFTPCFENIHNFQTAFLFSIETQTTIGYGYRYVTESCPHAYFGVIMQNIVGAGLQAALAGLVVAKVRRGKKRSGTIVFSTIMCIAEDDGKYKLMFRIGDMRKSHIIGIHIRGYLFKKVSSDSNEKKNQPVQCFPIDFYEEDGSAQIFVAWPTNLVHFIDKTSPFWKMSRDDIKQETFELVIILDGTVGTTSQPFQTQTSYFPWDIKWGHRFVTLGRKYSRCESRVVDFSNFHSTEPTLISDCSAYQVAQFKASGYSVLKTPFLNNNTNHITLIRQRSTEKRQVFSPSQINQYKQNKQYLARQQRF